MSRLDEIPREKMTDEQLSAHEQVVANFGRVGGPYQAYIRIPRFMVLNKAMGDYLRSNSVEPRLREFIVLSVARFWRARHVWSVNVRNTLKAGFDQETIDAINDQNRAAIESEEERLVFDLVTELLNTKAISDSLYGRALDHFGEVKLVDIVTTIGFYSFVSLTVNSFDMTPPDDATKYQLKEEERNY